MTIQREAMSPKGDVERPADFSGNCCDQTQISQSEVSPVQNTASEESESQEAQNQERVNLVASRNGPNLLSKSNKEKRSYAERENGSLVAQISDLQKQNARLNAGKNKSERDLVFLQGRFDRLEHEHSQLKLQKAGWAREKKTLSGSISKIENEKMKLESSNEVLEDDKQKLQSGLREVDLENANMRKRIKKIDNEKEKLKDGKAALEEQIIALNLHQTRLGSVIASLKEDNRTLNAQLNAFQDEEKIMRADKNFLQSKLAEFNSAKNKWVDTNNELSRMVGDLQRENAQMEEDNMRLIDQCSGLVQEISGLRLQHSIDDDSALQEKFHSLHFAIRSWCCQIHDAKPPGKSAVFRQFPLGTPGSVCQLSYLADHEVNVLIACTWEWMVKLIFGFNNAETGYHDSPDLWLEEDMAWCLHNLELRLQIQDPKAAVEWRSLTVRQLTMEGPSYQEARVANIVAKILRWMGACLHLDVSADSMAQIRHNLKAEVVTKAIEFSLFLRRQYSIVSPHIPQDLDWLSTYHLSLRTSQRRAEPKMCVRPQLRRLSLASIQGQLSYDIIVEAELSRVPSSEENQAQAPLPMEEDEVD